jgi:hypothetical protein
MPGRDIYLDGLLVIGAAVHDPKLPSWNVHYSVAIGGKADMTWTWRKLRD